MKISAEVKYAMSIISFINKLKDDERANSIRVSDALDVESSEFISAILGKLTKAGILNSKKGPGGGYALAKSPEKFSLNEVLEAVNQPFRAISKTDKPDLCNKIEKTLQLNLDKFTKIEVANFL